MAVRPIAGRRVFVTGASGFIGSHLVRRLVRDGAEVHALLREGSRAARLEDVRQRVTIWSGDITNPASLAAAIGGSRPHLVYHLAADTGVRRLGQGWAGVERSLRTNLDGTLATLRATLEAEHAVETFVRAGGLEEYGDGPTPYDERQREQPISPYSASQVAATHYCTMLRSGTSTSIVTLRPALVYGPGQSTDFMIPSLILSCLRGDDFEMTAGSQHRDLLYVDDAVEAFVLAATRPGVTEPIINVGTGVEHAMREVAEEIVRLTGTSAKLRVGARPPRASDLKHLVTSCVRADSLLGWRSTVGLTHGLQRTIEWYRMSMKEGRMGERR